MNRLSLFDKLLVYALVFAMAAAGLFPILRPVFREWRRRMCASRLRAACSAVLLLALVYAGGSLDKRQNGPLVQENLSGGMVQQHELQSCGGTHPAWYVARGYPQTDSDGDGIPDAWERWTRTNSNVDDALLDPDNDGVSNFEEYLYQCDPIRADTDGDGLNDRMEIDGLAAEVEDMDPLVQATYEVTEPDTNGDGIPDLWGDPMDYVVYTDWNRNGYCDDLEYDFEQLTNSVGVVFHVNSSRSCVLSTGVGYPLFLPPCTNFAVRARISTDSDTKVTLYGAPDNTYVRSTWKARLEAEWEDDGFCEIENDRIRTENGVILDMSTTCADFAGALVGDAPLRGLALLGAHAEPVNATNSRWIWFRKKTISLSGTPFCSIHGPTPTITATCTGVEPPLHWEVTGTAISEDGGVEFTPSDASGWTGDYMEIVCSKLDGHTDIVVQTKVRYAPAHCGSGETNIVGACWTSTHDPDDASDHEPGIEESYERYAANCPVITNMTFRLGNTHNTDVLHIRNLLRISTGDAKDDDTDHSIGIMWRRNGTINLRDYLDSICDDFLDDLYFKINGSRVSTSIIEHGSRPREYHPKIFHVELYHTSVGIPLDRMWIVLYSPDVKDDFDAWYDRFSTNLNWVASLPRPYAEISLTTNWLGNVSAVDPEPGAPNLWKSPSSLSTYLHHDAAYEMRSTPTSDEHGNQATYDANGKLIRNGMAGGTADYAPGIAAYVKSHVQLDVNPYLKSVWMDGNPGDITTGNDITRPCLYEGPNIRKYLYCRPVVQP